MPLRTQSRARSSWRLWIQPGASHVTRLLPLILIFISCSSISAAYESTLPRDGFFNERDAELVRREDSSTTSDTSTSATSSATSTTSSSSSTVSTTLPSAFDTGLGTNYTSDSCPDFIDSFLSNSSFKDCVPISLFLQNSQSFFEEEDSLVEMTATLDASCGADLATCATLMSTLAAELVGDANCGQDYKDGNALVLQAYAGLVAYEPVYNATCLKNETGDYCFADAITNSLNPSDSYPYYTALGIQLPGGISVTCGTCLKDTMAVFQVAAANKSQPVSSTYANSATIIDDSCGPDFVNTTIPIIKSTSGGQRSMGSSSYLCPIAALITIFMMSI